MNKEKIENLLGSKGGIFMIVVASLVLARAYLLYWRQVFHPGWSFLAAWLYLLPLLGLLRAGLSRLLSTFSTLSGERSRRLNAWLHLFFLPVLALCFRPEFSRVVTAICIALYLFSHLVLIIIYRDREKWRSARGVLLNISCCLFLALLVFLSYYKFLRLEHYYLSGDASHWGYGINLFLGRSVNQGVFPLWNPYNALGVPAYAEPASQYFFPLYLLAAMFSPTYGFYHFVVLAFIVPPVIGAIGFFALAKYLVRRRWIAFVVATAYAFSGFALHDNLASSRYSLAWLPYVVLFGVRALAGRRRSFRSCVAAAAAFALAIVSGYPTLWYSIGLHLALLAGLIALIRHRDIAWPGIVAKLAFIIILGSLLSAPYLITVKGYLPFTDRAAALPYERAAGENPLSLRSFITLWFPRTALLRNQAEIERQGGNENSLDMANFNGQDIGMRSVYLTIPGFIFSLVAIARWRRYRGLPLVLAGIAFFYLFVSLGGHGFLYKYFYYFVPFFSRTRHAALQRLFFIFYMLLLSAIGLRITFRNLRDRFLDRFFPGIIALALIAVFGFGLYLTGVILPVFEGDLTLYSHLFRDVIYALLFGGATLIFIINRRSLRYRNALIAGLAVIVIFDALSYAHARHRIFYRNFKVRYEDSLGRFKKDFSVVPNIRRKSPHPHNPNWVHDFRFTMGAAVVNPPATLAPLVRQNEFTADQYGPYTDRLFHLYSRLEYAPLHLALERMRAGGGKTAYLNVNVNRPEWFPLSAETAGEEEGELAILWYAPNLARLRVRTAQARLLEMVDTDFPGWRAFIGGEEVPINRVNYCFKGVFVPPGNHEVIFLFDPPTFIPGILISAVGFCGAILLCLVSRIRWWQVFLWICGFSLPLAAAFSGAVTISFPESENVPGKINLLYSENVKISASSFNLAQETPARLNDGDPDSFWHVSLEKVGEPAWVMIDFGKGGEKIVQSLRARPRRGYPKQFLRRAELYGSADGKTWRRIAEILQDKLPPGQEWQEWSFENNRPFRYYKLLIKEGHGDAPGKHFYSLSELAMYE